MRATKLKSSGVLLLALTSGCMFLPLKSAIDAPPGWYRVSVERAVIDSTREPGRYWDIGPEDLGAPDVYVQIVFDEEVYRTPVVPNTFQPMWVGSFDALLGVTPGPATARILLWDRDLYADDPIGEVTIDLYEVVESGGNLTVVQFGQVAEISLSVRYVAPPDAEEYVSQKKLGIGD